MRSIEGTLKRLERKTRDKTKGDFCKCPRQPIIHDPDGNVRIPETAPVNGICPLCEKRVSSDTIQPVFRFIDTRHDK
jgi:hypothetical protein